MRIVLLISLMLLLAGCDNFAGKPAGKPTDVNESTAKAFEACLGKGGEPSFFSDSSMVRLECKLPEPNDAPTAE